MNNQFKELFISYGRRESLGFAGRLHQRLKLAGYDAWFDKVNIPDGDDYAQRINHGIESAHNFVYVMAPRCLTSPYCLLELEYARLLGKRIIPINHKVIDKTDAQALSAGDVQVLVNFYKHFNLSDPQIGTTQQVLNRSLALIGKTDWLDAKEEISDQDCQELANWAKPYENNWAKHDDLNYLKTFEFQIFGKSIDALGGVVERLIAVLERQKAYVHKHTDILAYALHWHNNQRATQHFLVGKNRLAAEEWLLTEFLPPKQPPCQPSTLVCDFICEARKNAENLMTDIFICNDEQDKDIRNQVVQSLSRYAKTTWTHDKDIKKGVDYERAIEQGIENADNFFYFISPHSVTSDYCQRELNHALSLSKRIVPLLIAETQESSVPEVLRYLQYVDFTDNTCQADYDSDIDDILNILSHESEYYKQHKVLLARALQWDKATRNPAFLLRGHNLENAKTWLRLSDKREQHAPLALHQALITESEAAKGQLGTEVFISYSRKDSDFARHLNTALQEAGFTTWFDQESISTGVDFEKEIYKGIDGADNFVFVVSPDAVESEYCEREVNYAASHSKRFISVLHRETEPNTMPEVLRKINWIDFKATAFEKAFPELIQSIELDREHAHQHTVLQQRATEWTLHNRSGDFLLNITACANAESWQELALSENKQPVPTQLQWDFIVDSRKAIKKANRRRNMLFSFVGVLAIMAVILAGFAFVKMKEADVERENAETAKADALAQKDKAEKSEQKAKQAQATAEKQKQEAELAKAEAEEQKQKAEEALQKVDEVYQFSKKKKFTETAEQLEKEEGRFFQDTLADGSKGPEMSWLPAGKFRMGNIQGGGGDDDEKPVHEVSIQPFAISRYEIQVAEFKQFIEATGYKTQAEEKGCYVIINSSYEERADANWRNPYFPQGDNQPVVCVTWNDAKAYVEWLSEQTKKPYRLPSEAEWEYAARAGTETKYYWGNKPGVNWGNFLGSGSEWSFQQTAPVGSFVPNHFGLHDMLGNAFEWAADHCHNNYENAPLDGSVWKGEGDCRVLRGGSFYYGPNGGRAAYRLRVTSDGRCSFFGFRVAVVAWTK